MQQKNHVWEITITEQAGAPTPSWDNPLLCSAAHCPDPGLLDLLRDFKAQCDVTELHMTQLEDVRFAYFFMHRDTREWRQEIRIADPVTDTMMTFDVPDLWAINEIRGARGALLSKIIEFLNAYPSELIQVTWL